MRGQVAATLASMTDGQGAPLLFMQDGQAVVMSKNDARQSAAAFVRASAEDILALKGDTPQVRAQVEKLAAMTGVEPGGQKLQARPQLKTEAAPAKDEKVVPIAAGMGR
jgi:hypothetical protein